MSWYVSDQVVSQSRVFLSPKMYFLTVLTSQKEDTYEYFGQMKYGLTHFDDLLDIHYHLSVEYENLNPKLLEWEEINNSSQKYR